MKAEDNRCVYEGEDAFMRLPTSFNKSVHYKVMSFAICLTVNKASWVQGGCCHVSRAVGITHDC